MQLVRVPLKGEPWERSDQRRLHDTQEVTGSIPVSPTTADLLKAPQESVAFREKNDSRPPR